MDDAITRMPSDALRTAIVKSMRQYELASEVWNRYWRSDFVDGEYKNLAVKQYGVKKKGSIVRTTDVRQKEDTAPGRPAGAKNWFGLLGSGPSPMRPIPHSRE